MNTETVNLDTEGINVNSSFSSGLLLCLGCVAMIPGARNQLVNSVTFFPPSPSGYKVQLSGEVSLYDLNQAKYRSMKNIWKDAVNRVPARKCVDVNFISLPSNYCFHFKYPGTNKTIIYSHGNATDIGYVFVHLLDLSSRIKCNIIAYDYSGYGQSKFKPSEKTIYENINNVVEYVTNTLKIPFGSIFLYGQSIGSAPTINYASQHSQRKDFCNLGGVIIHSGLKSGVSVLCGALVSSPWYDAFRNLDKIQKITCPIFIIHGTNDRQIPLSHGKMLYNLCQRPYVPWFVNGAGHNDIETVWRDEFVSKIYEFISSASMQPIMKLGKSEKVTKDNYSLSRMTTRTSESINLCTSETENTSEDDNSGEESTSALNNESVSRDIPSIQQRSNLFYNATKFPTQTITSPNVPRCLGINVDVSSVATEFPKLKDQNQKKELIFQSIIDLFRSN
ncbi:hypothetical protein ACR3K2_00100 [Cryptosporidium serpentis]